MLKKLLILTVIVGMLFNVFSAPLSILVYQVNKEVQQHGTVQYKEISITVCETACAIQKHFTIEQHFPQQPTSPLKVSFNPLALYWQRSGFVKGEMKRVGADLTVPNQLGTPVKIVPTFFVPPKST